MLALVERSAGTFVGALAAAAISLAIPHAAAQDARRDSPSIAGTRRVLVIPVNIPGRAPVAPDREQIAQALFGDRDSVASRYRTISYGKLNFSGSEADIVDPVTVPEPPDLCNSGLGRLAGAAEYAARRQGARYDAATHRIFVVPADFPCNWVGLGGIGGERVWVKATTAKALEHELGHNLGMDHAISWQGFAADASDFMGSGEASLNAPHVAQMGWLDDFPDKITEISAEATVTLELLEAHPTRTTLAKIAIARPSSSSNTYYFSYRAASAANPLPAPFTDGVNIHIFQNGRARGGLTRLVKVLKDGETFEDGPMVVRQISHIVDEQVAFSISFDGAKAAIPAGPPPAPRGAVQSQASGKCLDLARGSKAEGAAIIQYDCHGGGNQKWSLEGDAGGQFHLVSRLSQKCLGPAQAAANGVPVAQSTCWPSADQLWSFHDVAGVHALQNVASGLCLDVPGGSTANGVRLILWSCNDGQNQNWRYSP